MDKINFEFFDFFGAVIPGLPVFIISCFLVNNIGFSFEVINAFLQNTSLSIITGILLTSYCIGFCLHYPSYEVYQPLVKKWGSKRTLGLPISIGKREKELATIRHKSPDNFKLINKFLALRQMSYTMFFSLLAFSLGLTALTFLKHEWTRDVFAALIMAILFGLLFLRRSVAFHQRIQEMLNGAILL